MRTQEWVLLNPGPGNVTPTVREALLTPDLCHREAEFFQILRDCREKLTRLAGGGEAFTSVCFTGSGTATVEAALCSVIPRDRTVLIVDNGVYGRRMAQMAAAHGIAAEAIHGDIFTPVEPAVVENCLLRRPDFSHVAIVHHETTTGLLNPVSAVAEVAARLGRSLIVDATSSLFGDPLDIAAPGIDFVTASATKCVQGITGISFVLARRNALEALQGRPPRSVYLDLYAHYAMQEQDNTPFTPAIQVLHALRQALVELEAEGVDSRIKRYGENARTLREGMGRLGFEILVPERCRSNVLTTFKLLPGLTYDALHDAMKRRGYIIYAGQGDIRTYAFRVANLGTLTPQNMEQVVAAFADSLRELDLAPR
jgi:2-aminoethylphosphonate-pyruvate transaminase